MANNGFPKASRLLDAHDFEEVFANNQHKVANRHFLILALQSNQQCSRLGMVVAKKNIPLAVQRNRIRRQIRESFRMNSQRLKPQDIIVLVRKGAHRLGNPEIKSCLSNLWADLEKKSSTAS